MIGPEDWVSIIIRCRPRPSLEAVSNAVIAVDVRDDNACACACDCRLWLWLFEEAGREDEMIGVRARSARWKGFAMFDQGDK
jgi:hypothetical protein